MMPFPDESPRRESSPKDQETTSRDDLLARRVGEQIHAHPDLRRQRLRIEVQNGVALLTGTVDAVSLAESAVRLARTTDGIRDVCDAIRLPSSPAAESAASSGDAGAHSRVADFGTIAAQLVAEDPALAKRPRGPLSTSTRIYLGVLLAGVWALLCILLVVLLN